MTYVYVVNGSEDGNVGVFSSKKKAYEDAIRYMNTPTHFLSIFDEMEEVYLSYKVYSEQLTKGNIAMISSQKDRITVDVEKFTVE